MPMDIVGFRDMETMAGSTKSEAAGTIIGTELATAVG